MLEKKCRPSICVKRFCCWYVLENDDIPKAAYCPFDKLEFLSIRDLEERVKRRRMSTNVLDIKPRPYGTCCRNRFDLVSPHSFFVFTPLHN